MKKYLLHNRYTLFAAVATGAFLLIILEGVVVKRDADRFSLGNPWFDLRVSRATDSGQ